MYFCPFFLLTIVLSVLRIIASEHIFGIFKLFFHTPIVATVSRGALSNAMLLVVWMEVAIRFRHYVFPMENPFHFCDRSIDTHRYRDDILIHHVAPKIPFHSDLRIFQQDNTHPRSHIMIIHELNNAMIITLTWHVTDRTCVGRARMESLQTDHRDSSQLMNYDVQWCNNVILYHSK